MVLLLATLLLSFSGYLLPWDQLAYWAVTIGASMADKVLPAALGNILKLLLSEAPTWQPTGRGGSICCMCCLCRRVIL